MTATVASEFANLARSHGAREALFDMRTSESISYSRLLQVCADCAHKHFQSSMLVMVAVEEGKDLVGIQLAAWLAGARVCPFDARRDPRVLGVIERLRPDFVVVASGDEHSYPFPVTRARELLNWDQPPEVGGRFEPCQDPKLVSHLVFTSGTSSGEPKCVVVSNHSLLVFARAKQLRSQITPASRIFLASSLVFDPQLGDIAVALTSGASLVLPNRQSCFLGGQFRLALKDSRSTHVTTTPAVLRLGFNLAGTAEPLEMEGLALQEVLVGGERMTSHLVEQFLSHPTIRLVNTYGVTECCVYQTAKPITQLGDESLLGEAYDGVTVHLLEFDSDSPVSGAQEEGEICLTGPMLGLGYLLGNGVVANPMGGFSGPGSLYRTGDVGQRVANSGGEIRYLGRRDAQYKVNGVRVEAEEVEYQLNEMGICHSAVVGFQPPHLVAFCVFKDAGCFPGPLPKCVEQIMYRFLSARLPATHIPTRIVAVKEIPLSATGKVDRRALLLVLQQPATDNEPVVEEAVNSTFANFVQHVWAEVLGMPVRTISLWDSFQSLGGDSLQALKVVNKILSRVRDVDQHVVQLANVQSQVFGEIEGPFSAASLLTTQSLAKYVESLRPFIPDSAFELEKSPIAQDDDSDANPAMSRALMDAARLGLRYLIELVLGFPGMSADGRFQPRKFPCKTPLHEAAQFGHLACVQLLLERGAKVMAVTEARISPLHLASTPEIVTRLVAALRAQRPRDCSTPMFICDKNDQTPIHFAARAGRWDVIQAYIEEQNTFNPELTSKGMNMFDHWRRTPLHWAVVNFHVECARFLLRHGCQIRPSGMRLGKPGPGTHLIQETPLQVALRRNAPQELIRVLQDAEKDAPA
ncbi:hypothetical protein BASA81_006123 [Batrachochytrium salamandrivorans]|nr:hypothetical protein BASA81_006123 [Batrachochytrium salamandrivorans]